MEYEPFPIGFFSPAFDPEIYRSLSGSWPKKNLFKHLPKLGNKFSLSEKNNRLLWVDVISKPPWDDFHRYLTEGKFIENVFLGLNKKRIDIFPYCIKFGKVSYRNELSCRWEFTMLSGDGGSITAHTDSPHKVVTLVLSFSDDWPEDTPGGTELFSVLNPKNSFNIMNRRVPFKKMKFLRQMPFGGNQCTLFVKTFNSLHGLRPLKVPGLMRKAIVVNVVIKKFQDLIEKKVLKKEKRS